MRQRKKMTLKEFLEHLGRSRKGRWSVGPSTLRYHNREANPGFEYCPITRVCRSVVGSRYTTYDYSRAAKALGLDRRTAKRIAQAADQADGSRLRTRLLRAIDRKGVSTND